MWVVYRYEEGISLNEREYALDFEGNRITFATKEEALNYLLDYGVTQEDIDEGFIGVENIETTLTS